MALATYTAYKTARDNPSQRIKYNKTPDNGQLNVSEPFVSFWTVTKFPGTPGDAPAAGAAPTTAAVPTNSTVGSFQQWNSAGTLRLLKAQISILSSGSNSRQNSAGMFIIADRLSHQGGLAGNVGTAQTTNLPTAALTRKTSGVGVMMALEVYTAASGTNATVSYTNSAGTSGRTTPTNDVALTGARTMSIMTLASGDQGVRAVASVTLTAGGTAGNFGVTLFYPIVAMPFLRFGQNDLDYEALLGLGTWFPAIDNNACLFGIWAGSGGLLSNTISFQGMFSFSED